MNGCDNNVISFRINGKKFTVQPGLSLNSHPKSLLIDFIRHEAELTGTKYNCREGGCGACVVLAKSKDTVTGKSNTRAINSCLIPVYSCDGLEISTVESLGNKSEGYDILQKRLIGFSGTQCGYCTPGILMNGKGFLKTNQKLTSKEIEDAFDGNICRCTGFRPIMDTMKSFADDASEAIKKRCAEFEEAIGKICPLKDACCTAGKCLKASGSGSPDIEDCCRDSSLSVKLVGGPKWKKPVILDEALALLKGFVSKGKSYRLVAANTSTGIFKNEGPYSAYVDLNGIPELKQYTLEMSGITFGGGVTLTVAIEQLKAASTTSGFEYASKLAKHWLRVANTPVRNAGTIAGNLMIKHAHREFPSDIFVTFEAIGAKLSIVSAMSGEKSLYTIQEFLKLDMKGNLIVSVHLPSLSLNTRFRSYKITKRYQSAHAYVNAAMLFKVDRDYNVVEQPTICFGGINPKFVHAKATEEFLFGKCLRHNTTLDVALSILEGELTPDFRPPDAGPEYRKALARNLLYKTLLGIAGAPKSRNSSGGADLEHALTSGKQVYDFRKEEFPLTQPIPKLEAVYQCSGEAEYVNDIRPLNGELFGAFVLAKVANADLQQVDTSEALKVPGVVRFLSAKDIPGENNYMMLWTGYDQIFIDGRIKAAGDAVGLIVAENRDAAFEGARKVKITYSNAERPILTIKEALAEAEKNGTLEKVFIEPAKGDEAKVDNPKHQLSGEIEFGGQFQFAMEPQVTLAVPMEGGFEVHSATQWMEHVQVAVASMLGVKHSDITVQVRRLGGAFGSKISRPSLIACGAVLAAHLTNRPVRVVLDLETNMKMLGKRSPYLCKYEVGFDDTGKIQKLKAKVILDGGVNASDFELNFAIPCFQSAYDSTGWEITGGIVKTNTVSNTYCRAPGSAQAIAMIESIMEHIAKELHKDPLEVRLNNLLQEGGTTLGFPMFKSPNGILKGENLIPKLLTQMKVDANYEERKKAVEEFNKANRWVKRGINLLPMRYPQDYFTIKYPCFVAIYDGDGSVAISHGGIEMGQGLNTKVAQTVAYELGIPLDKVRIKPTNNVVAANTMVTGGSTGSELVCHAAIQCCKILKERFEPVKAKLGDGVSWEKLMVECEAKGLDLRATYMPRTVEDDKLNFYNIWGMALTEVEVDVLTGEFKVLRVDLIQDAGKSISPEIDVGQVEGAFVFGLGFWLLENLKYDKETGELLTNNTWEYKVPLAKDIPEEFNVSLLCNAPNPLGVLGSKATGEPPLCMSISAVFALRQAIDSARQDAGNLEDYPIRTPLTPERILQLALTSKEQFDL